MPCKSPLTTGQKVIKFIESYCVVPEGDLVGQPVKLAKFQKKFIIAVYDNPHVTDTAILSMARKNAKTATICFLVLVHLVGPLAIQNSRIISGALSKEQAAEVYNLASKCVMMSEKLSALIKITPSGKKLIGLPMSTEYQAISAEGKTAHGKSPVVAILDEVGQIVGANSDFVDAITTAQGAYSNPLLIYISTQAQSDSDLFSLEIDDALLNKPPKTVCHLYAADQPDDDNDEECNVLDEKQWRKANPALGLFRSENDMRKQAEKASRMPSFENTFRNLNLNQRVARAASFIAVSLWKACKGDMVDINDCSHFYGGLDLSGKIDLTSLVLIGWHVKNQKWYIFPFFWTPLKGLRERAKMDKAPYDLWVKQGHINTSPKATIDYGFVARDIKNILQGLNVKSISFDRWRIDDLIKELDAIGIELPLIKCGQGFKDMTPALDIAEEFILNEDIVHGNHPVLNMCMANAMISNNPAGDRKLDKKKTSGRIDGAVALVMACFASRGLDEESDLDDFLNAPLVL